MMGWKCWRWWWRSLVYSGVANEKLHTPAMFHHVTATNWICWLNGLVRERTAMATTDKFVKLICFGNCPEWRRANYLPKCINIECLWYYHLHHITATSLDLEISRPRLTTMGHVFLAQSQIPVLPLEGQIATTVTSLLLTSALPLHDEGGTILSCVDSMIYPLSVYLYKFPVNTNTGSSKVIIYRPFVGLEDHIRRYKKGKRKHSISTSAVLQSN